MNLPMCDKEGSFFLNTYHVKLLMQEFSKYKTPQQHSDYQIC